MCGRETYYDYGKNQNIDGRVVVVKGVLKKKPQSFSVDSLMIVEKQKDQGFFGGHPIIVVIRPFPSLFLLLFYIFITFSNQHLCTLQST